jgi:predicted nucleic acid-binding protein
VKYLVDANVLSEPTKPAPDPRVVAWLRANEPEIAVDPVILGELRFGILILPKGRKRAALERWFDAGVGRLHCLNWDAETGLKWAECWHVFAQPAKPCRSKIASSQQLRLSTVWRSPHEIEQISSTLECALSILSLAPSYSIAIDTPLISSAKLECP